MIPITIDLSLREALPEFAIGAIEADIRVTGHDDGLWRLIDARLAELVASLQVEQVPESPHVAALRKAYRRLGKDPTRYRGSQEALVRRVLKSKGLYRINTAVDINNLVSMRTFHSIGMFDAARIRGSVHCRAGRPGETYQGIGRDVLNIEGLPVLCDDLGPFGSPTSDSERTKVTLETTRSLITILSFVGPGPLADNMREMIELLNRFASAETGRTETRIVT
jgi:DNA/RNA-binding domain of Phe-tRNA-synthetase-like protein